MNFKRLSYISDIKSEENKISYDATYSCNLREIHPQKEFICRNRLINIEGISLWWSREEAV